MKKMIPSFKIYDHEMSDDPNYQCSIEIGNDFLVDFYLIKGKEQMVVHRQESPGVEGWSEKIVDTTSNRKLN